MSQEPILEGWLVPMAPPRRWAHYLKDGNWLCGVKNWIPAIGMRPLFVNKTLPQCKKCQKKLEGN